MPGSDTFLKLSVSTLATCVFVQHGLRVWAPGLPLQIVSGLSRAFAAYNPTAGGSCPRASNDPVDHDIAAARSGQLASRGCIHDDERPSPT
jgi:hypothetical protein